MPLQYVYYSSGVTLSYTQRKNMNIINRIVTSSILKNIGAGFVFKVLAMLLSFIYVPIFRSYLGDVRYGIWATISSIVSWITLGDIGIGYGLRNKLTEALARNDKKEAQNLVSTAYVVMFFICLGLFIIYFILAKCFDLAKIFNISISDDNVNLALTITVFFMCLNLWLSLINTVLCALQKTAIPSGIGVLNQFINIIFVVIASKIIPVSILLISILMGVSNFLTSSGTNIFVFIKYNNLRPKLNCAQKKYIKAIASIGLFLFISQLSSVVMNSTDNILISHFFGAANVTPYSTAFKLFQIFLTLGGLITTSMWSAFTLHKERKDFQWMRKGLKRMNQATTLLSIGTVLLAIFLPWISDIWLQHHLVYDRKMLGVMAGYIILMNYSCNYASLLNGVGDIKLSTIIATVQAIINIPLSILLAVNLKLELTGIIGGTFLSIIFSMIFLPIEVNRWFEQQNKNTIN